MTLTLFQGHRGIRNINCRLLVLDSCPLYFKCCMVATYSTKKNHRQYDLCDWCVFKGNVEHIFGHIGVWAC